MTADVIQEIAEAMVEGDFTLLPPEMQNRLLEKAAKIAERLTPPPSTELEPVPPVTDPNGALVAVTQAMASVGMPSPAEWAALTGMAEQLSRSRLVPKGLQGEPDDIMLVLLTGRDLQIAPTQALNKIHVIDGKPSVAPELMIALVRRAGYAVMPCGVGVCDHPPNDRQKATAHGRRDGMTYEFTFTIADAERAGLCSVVEGEAVARAANSGKVLPWEAYTRAMLWARAVSALCRQVFPDVLMGVSYVPEELGAEVDATGEVIDATSYAPAGKRRDLEDAARADGWKGVDDFLEHDAALKAVVDGLPEDVRGRYWRWAGQNGLRANGTYTKDSWVTLHAKAVEKSEAAPDEHAVGDPISGGPTAEPVIQPGAPEADPWDSPADDTDMTADQFEQGMAAGKPVEVTTAPPGETHEDRVARAQEALRAAEAVAKGHAPIGREITPEEKAAVDERYFTDSPELVETLNAVGALSMAAVDRRLVAAGLLTTGEPDDRRYRLVIRNMLKRSGLWTDPTTAG